MQLLKPAPQFAAKGPSPEPNMAKKEPCAMPELGSGARAKVAALLIWVAETDGVEACASPSGPSVSPRDDNAAWAAPVSGYLPACTAITAGSWAAASTANMNKPDIRSIMPWF